MTYICDDGWSFGQLGKPTPPTLKEKINRECNMTISYYHTVPAFPTIGHIQSKIKDLKSAVFLKNLKSPGIKRVKNHYLIGKPPHQPRSCCHHYWKQTVQNLLTKLNQMYELGILHG